MAAPIGEVIGVGPQSLADAVKGQTWGVQIDGVMYDAMFTGVVSGNGVLLVKVTGKSRTRQQMQVQAIKE